MKVLIEKIRGLFNELTVTGVSFETPAQTWDGHWHRHVTVENTLLVNDTINNDLIVDLILTVNYVSKTSDHVTNPAEITSWDIAGVRAKSLSDLSTVEWDDYDNTTVEVFHGSAKPADAPFTV